MLEFMHLRIMCEHTQCRMCPYFGVPLGNFYLYYPRFDITWYVSSWLLLQLLIRLPHELTEVKRWVDSGLQN